MFELEGSTSTPMIWSDDDLQSFAVDGELWARNLLIERGVEPYKRGNVIDFPCAKMGGE